MLKTTCVNKQQPPKRLHKQPAECLTNHRAEAATAGLPTMQTRQIYAALTASTSGANFVELPNNARIRKITLCICPGAAPGTGDCIEVEISRSATNQVRVNDALGVMAAAGFYYTLTTSGAPVFGIQNDYLVDEQVRAGERVYLHATKTGSGTMHCKAILHYT